MANGEGKEAMGLFALNAVPFKIGACGLKEYEPQTVHLWYGLLCCCFEGNGTGPQNTPPPCAVHRIPFVASALF